MLCIIIVLVKNTRDMAACMRGYRIDEGMVCYLWFLTKVARCFEDRGLLVPTIFRCAVGEGLTNVIIVLQLCIVP